MKENDDQEQCRVENEPHEAGQKGAAVVESGYVPLRCALPATSLTDMHRNKT